MNYENVAGTGATNSEYIPIEEYTLILKHEMMCKDLTKIQLDEPIVVKYKICVGGPYAVGKVTDASYVVNQMFNRMKDELIRRVEEL